MSILQHHTLCATIVSRGRPLVGASCLSRCPRRRAFLVLYNPSASHPPALSLRAQTLQSVASAAQRVLRDDDSDASRSDGEDEGEETGAASGASSEESEGVETASSGSASSEDDMLDPSE